MRTLIVYNHPYEHSFCHAILEACQRGLKEGGSTIDIIDLNKDGFNPTMNANDLKAFAIAHNHPGEAFSMLDSKVLDYKERLQQAEHIVFIFPIWWMLMPALTKGFIDKVLFPEIAYRYDSQGCMIGILSNIKQVTVITTMATSAERYGTILGNAVWKALLHGTFETIGWNNCRWINFDRIKDSSPEQRTGWLQQVEEYFGC